MRRRCPVCRRAVLPTSRGNIHRHADTAGREVCPASGEPYRLTEVGQASRFTPLPRRVVV